MKARGPASLRTLRTGASVASMIAAAVLPSEVWEWIEQRVVALDRQITPVPGGSSDGIRGLVGSRQSGTFVKALPLNHSAGADEKLEVAVLAQLDPAVSAPALIGCAEVAGWFVALTEFIDGRMPDEPWPEADFHAVLGHLHHIQGKLAAAGSRIDLPTVADRMRGRADTWGILQRTGATKSLTLSDLDDWERSHLDRLAELECSGHELVVGDSLLHFDLRHDNVLFDSADRVRLLGWGRACRGPAWVDVICLFLESAVSVNMDEAFREWAPSADAQAVDAFLVVLASYWRESSMVSTGVPGWLLQRRKESLRATQAWLAHRWH